jgi:hypothetical protein
MKNVAKCMKGFERGRVLEVSVTILEISVDIVGNVSDIIALVSPGYDQTTLSQSALLGSELDQITSSRWRLRRRRRR